MMRCICLFWVVFSLTLLRVCQAQEVRCVIFQENIGDLNLCNNLILNNVADSVTNVAALSANNITGNTYAIIRDNEWDYRILSGSVAVDTGDSSCVWWNNDLKKKIRVKGENVDVGAFEITFIGEGVNPFTDTVYTVFQDSIGSLNLCNNLILNNVADSVTNVAALSSNNITGNTYAIMRDNEWDYRILSGSVAVDAGDSTCVWWHNDLKKKIRVKGENVDVGAFEVVIEEGERDSVYAVQQDTSGQLLLYNNIVINNVATSGNFNVAPNNTTNLLHDTDNVFVSENNYYLVENSPAENAGDNQYVSWTNDIKGEARRACEGTVDQGAFELQPVEHTLTLTATTTPDETCSGQITILAATGGEHYTWSHSNETSATVIVNPLVPACYTVTAYVDGDCPWSDTATICIDPEEILENSMGSPSTAGKRFWVSFMRNYTGNPTLSLLISSQTSCTGEILNPNTGWSVPFSVAANQTTEVAIPNDQAYCHEDGIVEDKGLLVTSTENISLYASNFRNYTYDVSNVLPETALSHEYVAQAYTPLMNTEFLIVATADETTVEIIPTKTTKDNHEAFEPYTITLNQGQTYQVISKLGGLNGDLSGSVIRSASMEKPIAVFNGNVCANVPVGTPWCDHVVEQAFGTRFWGRQFVISNTMGMPYDRVKITASDNNTTVSRDGTILTTLQAQQSYELELSATDTSCYIETSKACAAYLYVAGGAVNPGANHRGDPSMVWMSPLEQRINEITFATFNSPNITHHYVNVVTPTNSVETVLLDGEPISEQFHVVASNPMFSCARIEIPNGTHTLNSGGGVISHVYGTGHCETYAYSVGSKAAVLSEQLYVNQVLSTELESNEFCTYEAIEFDAVVNYPCDSIVWNFGDSQETFNGLHFTHHYAQAGTYPVSMTVFLYDQFGQHCTTLYSQMEIIDGYNEVFRDTICQGTHYVGHDFEYVADTTGLVTLTRSVDIPDSQCDSTYVLELMVNQRVFHYYDTICAGNDYDGYGFYLPNVEAGAYQLDDTVFRTPCDSITLLHLLVTPNTNDMYGIHGTEYICPGNTYTYWLDTLSGFTNIEWTFPSGFYILSGQETDHITVTFTENAVSGNITATGNNSCGNASFSMTVFPQSIYYTQIQDTVCGIGHPYHKYGFDIDSVTPDQQIYIHNYMSASCCDSTIVLSLLIVDLPDVVIQADTYQICHNDEVELTAICLTESMDWVDTLYSVSLSYLWSTDDTTKSIAFSSDTSVAVSVTVTNAYGCSISADTLIAIFPMRHAFDTVTICETQLPYTYVDTLFGEGTVSGEYVFVGTDVFGCDSVMRLQLTVNQTALGDTTAMVCDSIEWYGETYHESGDYPYTLTSAAGCDSIVTLHLTVNHPSDTLLNVVVMGNTLPYVLNDSLYTQEGTYTQYLQTSAGCDSTIILHLTVIPFVFPDNVDSADCTTETVGHEWGIEVDWSSSEMVSPLVIPLVGDIDGDEIPEIISFAPSSQYGFYGVTQVVVYNSITHQIMHTVNLPNRISTVDASPYGIIKLPNGHVIFVAVMRNQMMQAYDLTAMETTPMWSVSMEHISSNVGFADFNHDTYPEIYVGNKIFDAETGNLLIQDPSMTNVGGAYTNPLYTSEPKTLSPFASDVLGDSDVELLLGNEIYDVNITNRFGIQGNSISLAASITPPNGIGVDGHPQVADFNKDGYLDVFVSNKTTPSDHVGFYVWDVHNNTVSAPVVIPTSTRGKSIPLIADIDNDGELEVVIQCNAVSGGKVRAYKYHSSTNDFSMMWGMDVDEDSWSNSMTMFDFNNDGLSDLLMSDQSTVKILNGSGHSHLTGNDTVAVYVLSTLNFGECTVMQYPVVADVDADGSAEIVICGRFGAGHTYQGFLNVFKSAGIPWAPARKVWNQYMYNVTNVNEDLTVPQYLFNNATVFTDAEGVVRRPFNNFLQQATTIDQYGRPFYAVPDVAVEASASSQTIGDSVVLNFTYCNIGDNVLSAPYPVSVFDNSNSNVPLCTVMMDVDLPVDSCVQGEIRLPSANLCNQVKVSVNCNNEGIAQNGGLQPECDTTNNTVMVDLVLDPDTTNVFMSACGSYLWFGDTLTLSGVYPHTLTNAAGCDSVVTLNLTVNSATDTTINVTVVENNLPYGINDSTYTEAGTYTQLLTNAAGCDSILTLHLTVYPNETEEVDSTVCESELPITWNGVTFSGAGTDSVLLAGAASTGADSTVVMTLTVIPTTYGTIDTAIVENALPLHCNDSTYFEAGTYTQYLTNVSGCDSVLTVLIEVFENRTAEVDSTVCESELPITWNGVTFSGAGTDSVLLAGAASTGADSTVVMTLTVIPTTYGTLDIAVIENALPVSLNDSVYGAEGTYTQYLTNVFGCDSVLTVNLSVHYNVSSDDYDTICQGQLPFTWNDSVFTTAGVKITSLLAATGADSVVVMTLTVIPTTYETVDTAIVQNALPLIFNDSIYNAQGSYSQHYINAAGCDSVLTVNLTVYPNVTVQVDTTVCAANMPCTWHGHSFTAAGSHTVTLLTSHGADSVVSYHLSVDNISATVGNITHITCHGESTGAATATVTGGQSPLSYAWTNASGTSVSTTTSISNRPAETYTFTVTDHLGCTATTTVTLNTLNGPLTPGTVSADQVVCDGEEVPPFTGTAASGGDNGAYQWQISTNGTDWTPVPGTNNAQNYTYPSPAAYAVTLRRAWVSQSCGTVYSNTLTVEVAPNSSDTLTAEVCQGEAYQENGFDITADQTAETGEYTFEQHYATGHCDSAVILLLTVWPQYETDIEDVVCEGDGYSDNGFEVSPLETVGAEVLQRTQNLQSEHGCDSIVTLQLTVIDTALRIVPLTGDFCDNMSAELMVVTEMPDYVWSTGETAPTITVTASGYYSVTATEGGCTATAAYRVEGCQFELILPNAITPSDFDGVNDYFALPEFFLRDISLFEIAIFNRWGEMVYYSTDKGFKWNGEYRGEIQYQTIYNYVIKYTDTAGRPYRRTGSITVL